MEGGCCVKIDGFSKTKKLNLDLLLRGHLQSDNDNSRYIKEGGY